MYTISKGLGGIRLGVQELGLSPWEGAVVLLHHKQPPPFAPASSPAPCSSGLTCSGKIGGQGLHPGHSMAWAVQGAQLPPVPKDRDENHPVQKQGCLSNAASWDRLRLVPVSAPVPPSSSCRGSSSGHSCTLRCPCPASCQSSRWGDGRLLQTQLFCLPVSHHAGAAMPSLPEMQTAVGGACPCQLEGQSGA